VTVCPEFIEVSCAVVRVMVCEWLSVVVEV
jgi:hypothetical protein